MMTFEHNSWATLRLMDACRNLTEEQLRATVPGGYGMILPTLWHLVNSEGRYQFHLTQSGPDWPWTVQDELTLEQIESCATEMQQRWRRYFETSPAEDRRLIRRTLAGPVYEVEAGVIHAQIANHGNVHREQVCAILTSLGIEPPDISGWAFGVATGRMADALPPPASGPPAGEVGGGLADSWEGDDAQKV
jgi:uncharacterized damage-inducible protein DinB